jgi:cell division protein FtsN
MNRDESGKLWVYVESETAREVAVTEVPRPTPLQAPIRPPSQTQTPPPVPPALVQAPPPVPPPAPERRQVTVTIIPRLPPAGDGKRYILQVGSYRDRGMAEYRLFNLQNAGIATVMESQGTTIRIIVNGVYAEEIPALAEKLGKAGVTEIWVRER